MAMSAARSRSASSKIISGDLPPSSIVTSFRDEAAELAITFAAGDAAGKGDFGDARMLGQVLAGLRAHARQDVKHAVRQARFGVDPASFRAVSGVTSLGLKIIALPAASAGADFHRAIWIG